jgi:hypothetical protein
MHVHCHKESDPRFPASGQLIEVMQWYVMEVILSNRPNVLVSSARLQQALKRPSSQDLPPTENRALSILSFIVSLLGENYDFDELRRERPGEFGTLSAYTAAIVILFQNWPKI